MGIDKKSLSISIGKSSIVIEVTTFFLYRFPPIDIGNRYKSSITIDTSGMLSSPLGNRRPNCPSAQLPLAEIRRSDYKVSRISQLEYSKGTRVHFSPEVELSQLSREVIGPMLVSFPPEICLLSF